MKHPPYISQGATIGIVCPSGFMPLENVQHCITAFEKRGYTIKLGKTVGHQFNYFVSIELTKTSFIIQLNSHR